jgi:hypothetical protein
MEKGLDRDKKDLDYFERKADNPRIQSLELQLLKVRIRQLKETITSKEDKLKDIQKTLDSILKQAGKGAKPEKSADKENTPHEKPSKQAQTEVPQHETHAASTSTDKANTEEETQPAPDDHSAAADGPEQSPPADAATEK